VLYNRIYEVMNEKDKDFDEIIFRNLQKLCLTAAVI